jgi:membrane associated rhomboid family serine protease
MIPIPFTYIIIGITVIISIFAFSNDHLFSKFQLNPYQVVHRKQYYRLITHGFIHVGWWHLFVNMFVLYFFGGAVESFLSELHLKGFIKFPILIYIVFYLLAIVFAASTSTFKHKDDAWYNSVGASGAVSAVLFFTVFFNPWMEIRLYAAIPIPGIIFAVLYVIYSHYMGKKGGDNTNHDAHLLGAVFGFVFPLFIDVSLFNVFLTNLLNR